MGGIAFGLAIAGAVFLNEAQNNLVNLLPGVPLSDIQQLISGTNGGVLQSIDAETRTAVLSVIVHALRKVYVFSPPYSPFSMICCPLWIDARSSHVDAC